MDMKTVQGIAYGIIPVPVPVGCQQVPVPVGCQQFRFR